VACFGVRPQVAQVLLTLPYSFSQLGMLSGVLLQVWYGLMGSWTAYLISVLYVEYRTRKEKEGVSFRNHVIQVGRSVGRSSSSPAAQPTAHATRPHLRNRFRLLSVWFPRHMVLRGWGAGNWNLIWAETESNE
jgi:hypothetical protein